VGKGFIRRTPMSFRTKDEGQGMVEYALLIIFIALVLIIVLALLGSQLSLVFSQLISSFPD
jgi:pilus assembly protein Flp/PilA